MNARGSGRGARDFDPFRRGAVGLIAVGLLGVIPGSARATPQTTLVESPLRSHMASIPSVEARIRQAVVKPDRLQNSGPPAAHPTLFAGAPAKALAPAPAAHTVWFASDDAVSAQVDTSSHRMRLSASGLTVDVERLGARDASLGLDTGVIELRDNPLCTKPPCAPEGSLLFAREHDIEELIAVGAGDRTVEIRVRAPRGFSLVSPATGVVEVRDERGAARIRMLAPEAWGIDGSPVPIRMRLVGDTIRLSVSSERGAVIDPTWVSSGAMLFNRRGHSTITLDDGRELIVGGAVYSTGICELFDPVQRTFSAAGELKEPRSHAQLFRLADGRIAVLGGERPDGAPATMIEIFDPTESTFSQPPEATPTRPWAAFVPTLEGDFLMVGGDEGSAPTKLVTRIDPVTWQTTPAGNLLDARSGASAVALPGRNVWVAGGTTSSRIEVFDPQTQSSTERGSLYVTRSRAVAALLRDGGVLFSGGVSADPLIVPRDEIWRGSSASPIFGPGATPLTHSMTVLSDGQVLQQLDGSNVMRVVDTTVYRYADFNAALERTDGAVSRLSTGAFLLSGGTDGLVAERCQIGVPVPISAETRSRAAPENTWPTTDPNLGSVRVAGDKMFAPRLGNHGPGYIIDPKTLSRVQIPNGPSEIGAMAQFPSGRVVALGGRYTKSPETWFFDPILNKWASGPTTLGYWLRPAITRLADGRLLTLGGTDDAFLSVWSLWQEQPGGEVIVNAGFIYDQLFKTRAQVAAPMPDGRVFTMTDDGGMYVFDPDTFTTEELLFVSPQRYSPSVTVLEDGDILISGGVGDLNSLNTALALDTLRINTIDRTVVSIPGFPGMDGPLVPEAVRLKDGRVLFVGGQRPNYGVPDEPTTLDTAYVFDPATNTVTPTGSLHHPIAHPVTHLMDDGRVFVAGGPEYEYYDPATGEFTVASFESSWNRGAALSLLPSGDILSAGGLDGSGAPTASVQRVLEDLTIQGAGFSLPHPASGMTSSMSNDGSLLLAGGIGADLLASKTLLRVDPTGSSILAQSQLQSPRSGHGSVRLAGGDVLVLGGESSPDAERVDPESLSSSVLTGSPSRVDFAMARRLDGDVVVGGGTDAQGGPVLNIDSLDRETFSPTSLGTQPLLDTPSAYPLPGGDTLLFGSGNVVSVSKQGGVTLVDTSIGTPVAIAPLLSGDVVTLGKKGSSAHLYVTSATGGATTGWAGWNIPENLGDSRGFGTLTPRGDLYFSVPTDGPDDAHISVLERMYGANLGRPIVDTVPATLSAGASITLTGQGFQRMAQAPGVFSDLVPGTLVSSLFIPEAGGGPVLMPVSAVTDTSIQVKVPVSGFAGPGWLFVLVSGVPSVGQFTRLFPATNGLACVVGSSCASGYCVDGVCCDSACDGVCESCIASDQATGGVDGLCAPVAVNLDPGNDCPTNGAECGRTGVCDGNRACALAAKGTPCGVNGTCDAGSCLAPLPSHCDEAGENLVQPDTTTIPCAPFMCRDDACLRACNTDDDCREGLWCTPDQDCRGCSKDGLSVVSGALEVVCAPYVCHAGVCPTSCDQDQDCAEGSRCIDNTCGPYCDNTNNRLVSSEGEVDCSPFRCLDNACAKRCSTNLECATGFVCGLDRACRPFSPPSSSDSSCTISRAPGRGASPSSSSASYAAWLALLWVAVRRRARSADVS